MYHNNNNPPASKRSRSPEATEQLERPVQVTRVAAPKLVQFRLGLHVDTTFVPVVIVTPPPAPRGNISPTNRPW